MVLRSALDESASLVLIAMLHPPRWRESDQRRGLGRTRDEHSAETISGSAAGSESHVAALLHRGFLF